MTDPFPIFHQDLTDEIIKKIKDMDMGLRLKAIAINHHINRKKAKDKELEDKIQELIKDSEKKKLEILFKENEIITGERAPSEDELKKLKKFQTPEE